MTRPATPHGSTLRRVSMTAPGSDPGGLSLFGEGSLLSLELAREGIFGGGEGAASDLDLITKMLHPRCVLRDLGLGRDGREA